MFWGKSHCKIGLQRYSATVLQLKLWSLHLNKYIYIYLYIYKYI